MYFFSECTFDPWSCVHLYGIFVVAPYKSFYFESGIIEDWMTPVGSDCCSPCCCYCCYVALEVPAKINGSLSHPHCGTTKTVLEKK